MSLFREDHNHNFASRDGGGIFCRHSVAVLDGVIVTDNIAGIHGGGASAMASDVGDLEAVYVDPLPTYLGVKNGSLIMRNIALNNGGGIAVRNTGSQDKTMSYQVYDSWIILNRCLQVLDPKAPVSGKPGGIRIKKTNKAGFHCSPRCFSNVRYWLKLNKFWEGRVEGLAEARYRFHTFGGVDGPNVIANNSDYEIGVLETDPLNIDVIGNWNKRGITPMEPSDFVPCSGVFP